MTVFPNSLRLSQLPPLNDTLLLRSISSRSLEAGRRHARAGRVRNVTLSEDERVIINPADSLLAGATVRVDSAAH